VAHITRVRVVVLALLATSVLAAWPAPAEAQRRRAVAANRAVARPIARPVIVRGVVYRLRPIGVHPVYWRNTWWGLHGASWWGPYSPYSYGYGYGYGYGQGYGFQDRLTASVRMQVLPREAEVFIDGYSAGVVDDFDGVFQRLRLRPGGHEIVVYLDGYRTFRQRLYLNAGATRTIRHTLEPLSPGEPMDPPPAPSEAPDDDEEPAAVPGRRVEPAQETETDRVEPAGRFGTLAIRVQPADAEVVVDGERWSAPSGETRLSIQLSEGRHTVEVRKAGFSSYREDVLIRRDRTLTINVSLTE
jgi:hypothetical protein